MEKRRVRATGGRRCGRRKLAYAHDGQREADHFCAVVGGEDLASGVMRDDKHAVGDGNFLAPSSVLHGNAFVELCDGGAVAYGDVMSGGGCRHRPVESIEYESF